MSLKLGPAYDLMMRPASGMPRSTILGRIRKSRYKEILLTKREVISLKM